MSIFRVICCVLLGFFFFFSEGCIQDENIQIEVCILNWSQRPLCILYFAMCSHILSFSYGEVFPFNMRNEIHIRTFHPFPGYLNKPADCFSGTLALQLRPFTLLVTATTISFLTIQLTTCYMYLALSTMESMGGCMGHDECLGFPFKYIFHLSLLSISFNILKIIFQLVVTSIYIPYPLFISS